MNRNKIRKRIHQRVRKKIKGTLEIPRLSIHYSNQHIYAQLIDDVAQKTICSASTLEKSSSISGVNKKSAEKIGSLLGERAVKEKKIEKIVFDRGGHFYHGKIKALADAARNAGLQF